MLTIPYITNHSAKYLGITIIDNMDLGISSKIKLLLRHLVFFTGTWLLLAVAYNTLVGPILDYVALTLRQPIGPASGWWNGGMLDEL